MAIDTILVNWYGAGMIVTIEDALKFFEEDRFFIEVNDGKDLRIGASKR